MWIPWKTPSESNCELHALPDPPAKDKGKLSEETAISYETLQDYSQAIIKDIQSFPPEIALAVFSLGAVSSLLVYATYGRFFRRIRSSDFVTPNILAKKRWIKGVVTSVGDGDNFRLYHTPAFGWRWPLKFRHVPTKPKDTIHIRLDGVDAPETSHFGRPAQEHSKEALEWLSSTLLNKRVYCRLLKKDHYSRIVASVYLAPRFRPGSIFYGRSVTMECLRAGWGQVYVQEGAVYGRFSAEEYKRVEEQARQARRGIWVNGTPKESPAEYKRRYREL